MGQTVSTHICTRLTAATITSSRNGPKFLELAVSFQYPIFTPFLETCSLNEFYAALFHSPYTRLTQKAFAWLSFLDYKRNLSTDANRWKDLENYKGNSLEEILQIERTKKRTDNDRFTDKALKASGVEAEKKLNPHLVFGRRIGNM